MPISVGVGAGEERRMRRGRDLAEVAQQLHVGRQMVEMVVADQAAVGLAAELAELLFVDLLEQRALVPARVRIEPQIAVELLLRDVHDADLQRRVGLGIEDEVVQAAPGALDLLEFWRVEDLVHLRGQLLVEPRDHLLDRVEHVVLDQRWCRRAPAATSVVTAFSTSVAARSVRGLKLCFSKAENSSASGSRRRRSRLCPV